MGRRKKNLKPKMQDSHHRTLKSTHTQTRCYCRACALSSCPTNDVEGEQEQFSKIPHHRRPCIQLNRRQRRDRQALAGTVYLAYERMTTTKSLSANQLSVRTKAVTPAASAWRSTEPTRRAPRAVRVCFCCRAPKYSRHNRSRHYNV